jgi:hypothetical protein
MTTRTTDPTIFVDLTEGLADRNRLPLSHVLKVLREVESMVNDIGTRILHERGLEDQHPDFGIEIVANGGASFRKGSVCAMLAITRYVDVGILAAGEVVKTIGILSSKKRRPAAEHAELGELSARVISGLERIAFVNQAAKTKLRIEVKAPKLMVLAANMRPLLARRATLGDVATENLRSLRVPRFEEYNVRLYGKLFRLRDKPLSSDQEKAFWGELHRDNGETWRIRFKIADLPRVANLFTKQTLITGKAVYYSGASPKLVADNIEHDPDRDLVSAYDDLYGCDRDMAMQ